jgi:hypothetical protein
MDERRLAKLLHRLATLRANHHSVSVSRRRAVLRRAIEELEAELDARLRREGDSAVMRLVAPRHAPALGLYPEPLRRQA